ncbi:uncharacterized protein LOC105261679 [Musca domestica]|uniref:Uncharacterized protein LOC105261679 n=1 Tax=Musca domestica TaxID=7370 RepID=A0A1I8NK35_MUSDO|nr:uncharacterized protein LOC105261679 [Musca domestica]
MNAKDLNENQRRILMDFLSPNFRLYVDFHYYASMRWSENHEENLDNYKNVAEMLNYEANMEIREYLENASPETMPRFVRLFADFYESCGEDQEFLARKYMQQMEKQENMKWALLTPNDRLEEIGFDWPTILARFRKYGLNDVLIKSEFSYQNANKRRIYLKKPFDDIFNALNAYSLDDYNNKIPLPQGTTGFMVLWESIDKFEDKINDIDVEQQMEVFEYNNLPYPWLKKYLSFLMESENLTTSNIEFVIDDTAYVEALDNILSELDGVFLSRYLEVRFIYHLEMLHKTSTPNECMTTAKSLMPFAHEWIYAELHPELLAEISRIHEMFEKIIQHLEKYMRMDKFDLIPQEFYVKLKNLQLKVGNLPQENAKDLLENYYTDLEFDPKNYYGNYLKLLQFFFELEKTCQSYEAIDLQVNKEFFIKNPVHEYDKEIHTQHYPGVNVLIVPLMLLRPPIYHGAFEEIIKCSSLGTIMASDAFKSLGTLPGYNEHETENFAGVIGLHASYEIFFSSLTSEEISRYQTVFGLSSLQDVKKMFFLNALHYKSGWLSSNGSYVAFVVSHLSEFAETFDCKMDRFLKMF